MLEDGCDSGYALPSHIWRISTDLSGARRGSQADARDALVWCRASTRTKCTNSLIFRMKSLGGLTSENLEVGKLFVVDLSELLHLNDINSALAQLAFGHERT